MPCASCLDYLVYLKPELLNGQIICVLWPMHAILILIENLRYILLAFPSGAVFFQVDVFWLSGHTLLRGCSHDKTVVVDLYSG